MLTSLFCNNLLIITAIKIKIKYTAINDRFIKDNDNKRYTTINEYATIDDNEYVKQRQGCNNVSN